MPINIHVFAPIGWREDYEYLYSFLCFDCYVVSEFIIEGDIYYIYCGMCVHI